MIAYLLLVNARLADRLHFAESLIQDLTIEIDKSDGRTNTALVPYELSTGRVVMVDASAAKYAETIDYTLMDGTIVRAFRVPAHEGLETCPRCGITGLTRLPCPTGCGNEDEHTTDGPVVYPDPRD